MLGIIALAESRSPIISYAYFGCQSHHGVRPQSHRGRARGPWRVPRRAASAPRRLRLRCLGGSEGRRPQRSAGGARGGAGDTVDATGGEGQGGGNGRCGCGLSQCCLEEIWRMIHWEFGIGWKPVWFCKKTKKHGDNLHSAANFDAEMEVGCWCMELWSHCGKSNWTSKRERMTNTCMMNIGWKPSLELFQSLGQETTYAKLATSRRNSFFVLPLV